MSSKLRRFEILLPQQFNDGREVPRKLLGLALDEIVDKFEAASFEPTGVEVSGDTKVSFLLIHCLR